MGTTKAAKAAAAKPAAAKEHQTDPIRLRAKVLAARACLIRAQDVEDGTGDEPSDDQEASALRWEARDILTELDLALQALATVTR